MKQLFKRWTETRPSHSHQAFLCFTHIHQVHCFTRPICCPQLGVCTAVVWRTFMGIVAWVARQLVGFLTQTAPSSVWDTCVNTHKDIKVPWVHYYVWKCTAVSVSIAGYCCVCTEPHITELLVGRVCHLSLSVWYIPGWLYCLQQ